MVDVIELVAEEVCVDVLDDVTVDVWDDVTVLDAVLDGHVSHLAGHFTATGIVCDPSVRTVEHESSLPRRQSSGSGKPLHSSLVLVVVAVVVAVLDNVDDGVDVGVEVGVVVGVLDAVVVCVLDAVLVGEVVGVVVGVLDAVVVAEVVADVVAVDVTVTWQLSHMIGQRLLIGIPNRCPPHSSFVNLLQALSSNRLLHRSGVVAVVVGDVVTVLILVEVAVDVAVDVCVVSHPDRSKSWSGSSRYAVTRALSAATVSPHVWVGIRTTVCQMSTAVFEAPENNFAASFVSDALARRGTVTLRPPTVLPSTTLKAAHSYISLPKSP